MVDLELLLETLLKIFESFHVFEVTFDCGYINDQVCISPAQPRSRTKSRVVHVPYCFVIMAMRSLFVR